MFLLLVNLYEFGQFLRILLWISVPMIIVAMLVTTWLHYRRRRKTEDGMALSMEGLDLSAPPEILIAAMRRMSASPAPASDAVSEPVSDSSAALSGVGESPVAGEPGPGAGGSELPAEEGVEAALGEERETITPADAVDNMYKGILWMKEKYEQYRDLADQRIEQLKEQVAKVEKKYQDLLEGRSQATAPPAPAPPATAPSATAPSAPATGIDGETEPMDQRIEILLQAKDRQIEELQTQLQMQWLKTEDLVARLQSSSQLLLNISQELDKSRLPPQPQA
jgi:hypothetical protein